MFPPKKIGFNFSSITALEICKKYDNISTWYINCGKKHSFPTFLSDIPQKKSELLYNFTHEAKQTNLKSVTPSGNQA